MTTQNLLLKAVGISDIGSSRINNEDVWLSIPEIGFFALADGMGGHKAGEIAAQKTIDFLKLQIKAMLKQDVMELIIEVRHAIEKANQYIQEIGSQCPELQGMGTTLCCLIWTKDTIVYAHVGDSRIYRFRNNKLSLLTQDHSLLAKWLSTGKLAEGCTTPFPYKHIITRSIGGRGKANPEISVAPPKDGDLFFLCSDGLSDVLSLGEMEQILNTETSLQSCANELINRAKIKGGSDNMTVLMVQS